MSRADSTWRSERLGADVHVVRWGEVGAPVLLFPTAGGDAEEVERFHLVRALAPLLEAGRIKVYSVDSVAGRGWLAPGATPEHGARVQLAFDACLRHEIVPAIHTDCGGQELEITTAGASVGAYNALLALCRHPDLFARAVCLSGTYDPSRFVEGHFGAEARSVSPLHLIDHAPEDERMQRLRERFCLLAHGTGRWEDPNQSWRVAQALGARGVPNHVDEWGPEWDHDWPTWREQLPKFLDQLLP